MEHESKLTMISLKRLVSFGAEERLCCRVCCLRRCRKCVAVVIVVAAGCVVVAVAFAAGCVVVVVIVAVRLQSTFVHGAFAE